MKAFELPVYDHDQQDTLHRLKRIEGQVRGLARMVDERQACVKVLQQLASVQSALRGVSKTVLRNCLERCANSPATCGDTCDFGELMDVIYKFAK
jgi:CsoR family transcriptional regulator, copper-sensing transcriptional repressor